MKRAIELARSVEGTTSPNPPVGAIVVRDAHIAGEGATQPPGGPHAEIMALRQAGHEARGATLYVTLEPCSHYGRTPPCADAIVASGVAQVHVAVGDPNPLVRGRGLALLKDAGIGVVLGEEEEAARELMAGHVALLASGRPLVTAMWGAMLPGRSSLTRVSDAIWDETGIKSPSGHKIYNLDIDRVYDLVLHDLATRGIARVLVTDLTVAQALVASGLADRIVTPHDDLPPPGYVRMLLGAPAGLVTFERHQQE